MSQIHHIFRMVIGSLARRPDALIAAGLGLLTTVVVAASAGTVGFTRDEGYYFKAADLYADWWRLLFSHPVEALSATGINAHLGYNPEHPFLMKGLFGLAHASNSGPLKALGLDVAAHTAMRFPAWVAAGVAVAMTYLLTRRLTGRAGAVFAALLFITMPRVFFHTHLACFDIPVVAAHAALVLAYVRWRESVFGAVGIGVVFGVAAATKHNVLPVPALFVLHWLLTEKPWRRLEVGAPLTIPLPFLSLAVVGPVVYVLLWPWLWPDVVGRFGSYLAFHLRHEHYPILYFGELLTAPPFPWTFPIVMWALTIPVVSLVCLLIGVVWGLRQRRLTRTATTRTPRSILAEDALLYGLNIAFPVLLIALPTSPIFGGTKHWMNALPFACALAGAGVAALVRTALPADFGPWRRRGVAVVVGAAVLGPAVMATAHTHPTGLSSYNELAGFQRGAANLGMQRTFWGHENWPLLPRINERAANRAQLHNGDVNADATRRAQLDGLLREDLRFTGNVRAADVAHVEPQGEFRQQQLEIWNHWGTSAPDAVVDIDGVPLSTLTFKR